MANTNIPLEWSTIQKKVKDLIPLAYNPRKLTYERKKILEESLEKFGLVEIPVINIDGKLVAGNQRVKLLMELGRGEELIDVRIPNRALTEQEVKEYNITSNTHVGIWDIDILEEVFSDVDLEGLGMNMREFDWLKKQDDLSFEPKEDGFEIELPKTAISQRGDLYELISKENGLVHRVLCGDSTKGEYILKLMDGSVADMVLSDPPYNVDYEGTKGMKIQNDKMGNDQFYHFLTDAFSLMYMNIKDGGCIYIAHADTEGANFRMAFVNAKFMLKQCLIWVKNSAVLSRQDYNWKHEPILYGWKGGAAHYFIKDFKQTTVFEIDRPSRNDDHPTMKPIKLWSKFIVNSSQKKDKILDSFIGSGTTLIACEQSLRQCYGMDLDEKYIDVTIRRWVEYMTENFGLDSFTIKLNGQFIHKDKLEKLCLKNQEKETSSQPELP